MLWVGWLLIFLSVAIGTSCSLFLKRNYIYTGLVASFILLTVGIILVIHYTPIPIPSSIFATLGNMRASVEFSSVPNAISYTVTSTPGNRVVTGTSSPIMVTGLINGVSYTFTVSATTARGTSALSDKSNAVVPRQLPTAPVTIVATSGNESASVSFTRTDGGQANMFTVTSNPGNMTQTGSSSPIVINGLTNGVAYTFTVKASDSIGQFNVSTASNSIVPSPPLYIPLDVTATALNRSALVYFSTSGIDGMSYTVKSNPGDIKATGMYSPILITGLTNGTSYIFTVTSKSQYGTSLPSTGSSAVTPTPPPMAPSEAHVLVYGGGEAYIGFTSPYPYNDSIVYTATAYPGGKSGSSSIAPILISGLTVGHGYIFTVTATNPSGTSEPTYPTPEIIMT